jgi:hypothetical protein
MRLARDNVFVGVWRRSRILQSGWKALKWRGTSGPRCSATHSVIRSISSSESFSPGINRVVSSSHTSVSWRM